MYGVSKKFRPMRTLKIFPPYCFDAGKVYLLNFLWQDWQPYSTLRFRFRRNKKWLDSSHYIYLTLCLACNVPCLGHIASEVDDWQLTAFPYQTDLFRFMTPQKVPPRKRSIRVPLRPSLYFSPLIFFHWFTQNNNLDMSEESGNNRIANAKNEYTGGGVVELSKTGKSLRQSLEWKSLTKRSIYLQRVVIK